MNIFVFSIPKIKNKFTLFIIFNLLFLCNTAHTDNENHTSLNNQAFTLLQKYRQCNFSPEIFKLVVAYCHQQSPNLESPTSKVASPASELPVKQKYQDWMLSGWAP